DRCDAAQRLRQPPTHLHVSEQPRHIRQEQQLPRWQGPRCQGSDGRAVDWWILLKYPNGQLAALLDSDSLPPMPSDSPGKGRETWLAADGGASDEGDDDDDDDDGSRGDVGDSWWRPGVDINDPNEPLLRTLAAAAAAAAVPGADADGGGGSIGVGMKGAGSTLVLPPATGFAFYNHADPEGVEHWGFAHSKGLLVFGPSGGLWLTHSFPSFPGSPPRRAAKNAKNSSNDAASGDGADRPTDGSTADDPWDVVRHAQTVYGQHALCLTLMQKDIQRVAESLLVAQAYVYDHVMPYSLVNEYGAVQDLIDASKTCEAITEAAAVSELPSDSTKKETLACGSIRRMLRSAWGQIPRTQTHPAPPPPPPLPPPPAHNVSQRLLTTLAGSTWLHVTKSPDFTEPFHE
ncbi:hypothetical protein Vretifemale_11202, partial [Volvox reticuliferus]